MITLAARCLVLVALATIPDGVFSEKSVTRIHSGASFERLIQGATFVTRSDKLRWIRQERKTLTDPWMWSKSDYSARYQIVDVASRLGGEELFVAGIVPNEKSVIEKWKFPRKKGRLVMTMTNPAPPIGTPAGAWSASLALHGAVLNMTTLPPTWYPPEITVIMETTDYGFIRSIEVDPEGRFVMFQRYPEGDVYTIDLSAASPTPALAFSAAAHPELATGGDLRIGQHATWGRVCVAAPAQKAVAMSMTPVPDVLYLIDSNNDGLFESTQTVSLATHFTSMEASAGVTSVWGWPWQGN